MTLDNSVVASSLKKEGGGEGGGGRTGRGKGSGKDSSGDDEEEEKQIGSSSTISHAPKMRGRKKKLKRLAADLAPSLYCHVPDQIHFERIFSHLHRPKTQFLRIVPITMALFTCNFLFHQVFCSGQT